MIKEFICYSAICDNCEIDIHNEHDVGGYGDLGYVKEVINEANWYTDGDKHYCDDCWYYDDEDNILIKTENSEFSKKLNKLKNLYYEQTNK